jgi:threonine synthase
MHLCCVECAARQPADLRYACAACGGILEVRDAVGASTVGNPYLQSGMWRYSEHLAVTDTNAMVSLGEGMTPLHRADRLARRFAGFDGEIWLKDETSNPTGSFKDRHVSAAVSRARELGCRGIVCASSGNAGASASAYAARAGLRAVVIVPTHTPAEKLLQIGAYGASVVTVDGDYSNSYRVALQLAERYGLVNVTTTYINPYGTDALKLVAHEIAEQMAGQIPDYVLIPTGAGPLVKGVVQGFRECAPGRVPKPVAVQAAGCSPIVRAFAAGDERVRAWEGPATIASGIADPLTGYERDGTYTLRLIRETGGLAVAVDDPAIIAAMRALATDQGILAEPTGAAPVAALAALLARGELRGVRVACLITGHGFKDFKLWAQAPARMHHLGDAGDTGAIADLLAEVERWS